MRDPGIEIIFGRIGRAVANIGGVRGECPYLAIGIAIGAEDLRPARNAPVEVDLEAAQADLVDRRRRLETRRREEFQLLRADRKSRGLGKRVSVRVDPGGRGIIKKKKMQTK